ncbi:hypothetical protein BRAO375_600076 [Bradyrhizobium sp. ORS 375]|uniref:TIGR04255 family protein n=1 Tax=Bradyrhizobium sp. (strain ORS 375) TaxID=566679 RepID=UPI000240864C|nr:TIGR04255 family protein [Bradyrhizobium sp. ORS 375]CCD96503.1 hypothetical protein BRAO375_600076 [Bradyrhizobium sp. ORS 375]
MYKVIWMKFPERTRVLYEENPLTDVICHFDFPRVLAIDNELPVDFQKLLVSRYPLLKTRSVRQRPTAETSDEITGRRLIYEFSSANEQNMILLGSDFLGVRTFKYERWESFREGIETALRTLLATYTLSVFTGISLNYVNVVNKEALGLKDVPWGELIRSSLIGPLSETEVVDDSLEEMHSSFAVPIGVGHLRILSALVEPDDEKTTTCFSIDNEFTFDESVDADESKALAILRQFNLESGRVFRWCITERLHQALRPTPIA